jgi:hypothetical protein
VGKYGTLGSAFDRIFRNTLNKALEDVDTDINAQKKRVDDLIKGTQQPSEVVDSRGGFPVLRDRLDDLSSSLAQIATNVKSFGAKGDGVTNDTAAVQSALNYCADNGNVLFFPKGDYLINSSLVLKANKTYKIVGSNNGVNAFSDKNSCKLLSNALNLFISDNPSVLSTIELDMSGLFIRYMSMNPNSVLFNGFDLQASDIHHNAILNFGTIFKGTINAVSKVHDNFIENISNCFSTYYLASTEGTITDSSVYNNYLNGNPSYNITMFKNGYTNFAVIENNFIDFVKYVINPFGGLYNVKFIANTFDVCFRFSPKAVSANFIGNTFSKFAKSTYLSRFPSADTDMINKNWGVFYEPLFNTIVTGSVILECDKFYYIDSSVEAKTNNHDLKITSNSFLGITPDQVNTMYYFYPWVDYTNITMEFKNIYIDDLMGLPYAALPSLGTNEYRNFFVGQTIDYNGKILRARVDTSDASYNAAYWYRYIKWYDMSGNIVTA